MAVKSSQQKMREIEYAAIALISGEGINAASFRKVAAASGYSLGYAGRRLLSVFGADAPFP